MSDIDAIDLHQDSHPEPSYEPWTADELLEMVDDIKDRAERITLCEGWMMMADFAAQIVNLCQKCLDGRLVNDD